MSEQVLTILKFCLLALVYLFLARVVWVVARELRGTPAVANVVANPEPRARKRTWRLVVSGPDTDGPSELWVDGEATVGRGGGCTISVPSDTFVSQVHARLAERNGALWIEDLGSTNGTFVNGKQLTDAVRLRKGDRVQIGNTLIEADK